MKTIRVYEPVLEFLRAALDRRGDADRHAAASASHHVRDRK